MSENGPTNKSRRNRRQKKKENVHREAQKSNHGISPQSRTVKAVYRVKKTTPGPIVSPPTERQVEPLKDLVPLNIKKPNQKQSTFTETKLPSGELIKRPTKPNKTKKQKQPLKETTQQQNIAQSSPLWTSKNAPPTAIRENGTVNSQRSNSNRVETAPLNTNSTNNFTDSTRQSLQTIEWEKAVWWVVSQGDCNFSYLLLQRIFNHREYQLLEHEECVHIVYQLYKVLQQIRSELQHPSPIEVESIVCEVISVLSCSSARMKDKVSRSIEMELIEFTTELLMNRTTFESIAVFEKWELYLRHREMEEESKDKELKEELKDKELKEELKDSVLKKSGKKKKKKKSNNATENKTLSVSRRKNIVSTCRHALDHSDWFLSFLKSRSFAVVPLIPLHLAQWTREIHSLFQKSCLSPQEEGIRKNVVDHVQRTLQQHPLWRSSHVYLFGSSRSRFGSSRSDLDLCVLTHHASEKTTRYGRVSERELRMRQERLMKDSKSEPPIKKAVNLALEIEKAWTIKEKKQHSMTNESDQSLSLLLAHGDALIKAAWSALNDSELNIIKSSNEKEEVKAIQEALSQYKIRRNEMYIAQSLLQRHGYNVHLVLVHSRVPLLRFTDSSERSGLECDLCFNNPLACANTSLLRTYGEVDERVWMLGMMIKHWVKQRGINDASIGFLSSYSYTLLTIFYLQVKTGVLMNLQATALIERCGVKQTRVEGYDTSFCTDLHVAQAFHKEMLKEKGEIENETNESIAALLFGFFVFYSREFDFVRNVVSIRCPHLYRIKTKQEWWENEAVDKGKRVGVKSWRISIEDPFEIDRDLGNVLQIQGQKRIIEELNRACEIMHAGGSFVNQVCEVVEASKSDVKGDTQDAKTRVRRRGGKKAGHGAPPSHSSTATQIPPPPPILV